MTDPVDSSKGFLERWSRKKIDAERETVAPANAVSPSDEVHRPNRQSTNDAESPAPAAPKPEFDLTSLPSLDSISGITDIRAFLTPGVPTDLARAALRRAWAADPAIRDFKGLAENDWDFTDPTAMPGFGPLPPGMDVKKMLAHIFGGDETPPAADAAAEKPTVAKVPGNAEQTAAPNFLATDPATGEQESRLPEITSGQTQIAQSDFVQRDNNTALHNNTSDDDSEEYKNRRHHGGALPQ